MSSSPSQINARIISLMHHWKQWLQPHDGVKQDFLLFSTVPRALLNHSLPYRTSGYVLSILQGWSVVLCPLEYTVYTCFIWDSSLQGLCSFIYLFIYLYQHTYMNICLTEILLHWFSWLNNFIYVQLTCDCSAPPITFFLSFLLFYILSWWDTSGTLVKMFHNEELCQFHFSSIWIFSILHVQSHQKESIAM